MSTPDMLPGIPLANAHGDRAFVTKQGAQVVSWQTGDGKERLYFSPLTGGMREGDPADVAAPAIRAGIPISLPQFSGRGPLPKHGFVRNYPWETIHLAPATASLRFRDQAHTRGIWPHAFEAQSDITLDAGHLTITLAVTNRDSVAWSFTAALHTYLRVDDVREMTLHGLQGLRFEDAADGSAMKTQQEADLRIGGEVDRVYLAPPSELLLSEHGAPALRIAQQGFTDTVVWNPGPDKARALTDFPDDDWLHMVCVEAACASAPVMLQPGERWEGRQVLSVA